MKYALHVKIISTKEINARIPVELAQEVHVILMEVVLMMEEISVKVK
jgi:hypothetical protein